VATQWLSSSCSSPLGRHLTTAALVEEDLMRIKMEAGFPLHFQIEVEPNPPERTGLAG
jgi:hypothetical protein